MALPILHSQKLKTTFGHLTGPCDPTELNDIIKFVQPVIAKRRLGPSTSPTRPWPASRWAWDSEGGFLLRPAQEQRGQEGDIPGGSPPEAFPAQAGSGGSRNATERATHLQRPQPARMAKDSPSRRAHYQLHSEEPGKDRRCARSDRRRKHDLRCRKRLASFLWVRRQSASRKAKAHPEICHCSLRGGLVSLPGAKM